jgi:hypothetical protein
LALFDRYLGDAQVGSHGQNEYLRLRVAFEIEFVYSVDSAASERNEPSTDIAGRFATGDYPAHKRKVSLNQRPQNGSDTASVVLIRPAANGHVGFTRVDRGNKICNSIHRVLAIGVDANNNVVAIESGVVECDVRANT